MAEPPLGSTRIYVSAFFCQSVIHDKNDVLTAVRITNGYSALPTTARFELADGQTITQGVYTPLRINAVLVFYSEQPAEFTIRLQGTDPEGIEMTPAPPVIPCRILGGAMGHAINVTMYVPTEKQGDLWFNVYLDDSLAAKMPLRITHGTPPFAHQPSQTPTPPAAAFE
jgi:hypothetical protein